MLEKMLNLLQYSGRYFNIYIQFLPYVFKFTLAQSTNIFRSQSQTQQSFIKQLKYRQLDQAQHKLSKNNSWSLLCNLLIQLQQIKQQEIKKYKVKSRSKRKKMFNSFSQPFRQYPVISFSCMVVLFALLGYMIVTRYLMEKQIRNFLPKSVFIITFVCSVSLLAMYMYEISLIHMSQTLWDVILSMLVIMCTIVIPVLLLLKIPFATYQIPFGPKVRIPILGIVIILLYLRKLSVKSGEIRQAKKLNDQIGMFSKQHINILIEILMNYGVVIMALMSSYGAIWCPYIYFNHTGSKRDDLLDAKKKAKDQIFFIIEQIKKSKYTLILLRQKKQQIMKQLQNEKNQKQSTSFIFRGIRAIISPFSDKKKQQSLVNQQIQFNLKELQTLYRVHNESFSTYRQIVDQQRKHLISETYIGKIFWLFSIILAVYSITRFILTAWNIIKGRKLSTDPITRCLNFIVWILNQDVNETFRVLSQYISFGFMGYLMISSVRSFSINLKNFIDFVLRRRRLNILSTDTLVLLLSEMYGIYFLSAVILLQSSLPRTYVTNFEHIVGDLRLVDHFTFFDILFFWFCILSAIFIILCQWQRKNKMNNIIKQRNFVEIKTDLE